MKKRSNSSISYVWLDTKTGFNDEFTKPEVWVFTYLNN